MKKLILITGSGRSGTSLLSGHLKKNYMSLETDEIEPDNSNPYGYFEDASLIQLNEKILKKLNILKYFPFSFLPSIYFYNSFPSITLLPFLPSIPFFHSFLQFLSFNSFLSCLKAKTLAKG